MVRVRLPILRQYDARRFPKPVPSKFLSSHDAHHFTNVCSYYIPNKRSVCNQKEILAGSLEQAGLYRRLAVYAKNSINTGLRSVPFLIMWRVFTFARSSGSTYTVSLYEPDSIDLATS